MKTQIFDSYSEFFKREDKEVNGVNPQFAKDNPDFEKQNETNKGCWCCSDCSDCSDCSGCSDCSDCSGCSRCSGCYDCSRCSGCYDCSDCSDCSRCSGCYDCSDCSNIAWLRDKENLSPEPPKDASDKPGFPEVPVIENIHQKVFEAVNKPEALDMSAWHTCETTHCRAGWVVTLAGEQGKKLEQKTSTQFAAMQIYKASSPIKVIPPRFFDPNNAALTDMQRCAEEEKSSTRKMKDSVNP